MTTTLEPPIPPDIGPTLQELLDRVGDVPVRRIRLHPFPATEEDVLDVHSSEKRLCELIDEVLVEKVMGWQESIFAAEIARLLGNFVKPRKLGVVAGAEGMMRLAPRIVLIPDVSFVSWSQFPGGKVGPTPIPSIHPDIAVEVLSEGNTAKEMERKRKDYFKAGTRLVWIVDPKARSVAVYTPEQPETPTVMTERDAVGGEPVLPGFSFVVRELFEELEAA